MKSNRTTNHIFISVDVQQSYSLFFELLETVSVFKIGIQWKRRLPVLSPGSSRFPAIVSILCSGQNCQAARLKHIARPLSCASQYTNAHYTKL
jgi:hypothetical protein